MVDIACLTCGKNNLKKIDNKFICEFCNFGFNYKEGVLVEIEKQDNKEQDFYEKLYKTDLGKEWLQGLNRQSFFKKILEKISLSYCRERFFKRNLKGKDNVILDIACGAGRDYFKKYGEVVGVDLSFDALKIASKKYDLVLQSGVDSLPFLDDSFDYVVSSDFFGHIKNEDKDKIIKEIARVLKSDGKTLHVIETDSENIWFKIAHKNPELFQKYFIEEIGGHVGLEMPVDCIKRWEKNNFSILKKEKIWGLIWPIQDYTGLFNNEYSKKSKMLKLVVGFSKILSKFKLIKILVNIVLNPVNWFFNKITSLNNGQGLMLVCKKK